MTIPLFVTGHVPLDTINEVLNLGVLSDGTPFLELFESPEYDAKGRGTDTPVKVLKTGFSYWSVEQVGVFMQTWIKEHPSMNRGTYDGRTVCLLDQRSVSDRTLNLGMYTSERREVPENPDYGPPPAWLSLRIRFANIAVHVAAAPFKSFMYFGEDSIDEVDENGVFTPKR